jgi:hypothetical protein
LGASEPTEKTTEARGIPPKAAAPARGGRIPGEGQCAAVCMATSSCMHAAHAVRGPSASSKVPSVVHFLHHPPCHRQPPTTLAFPVPESRSRSYTTTTIQIAPPYRPYLYVHACRSVRVHCDNTRDRDTSGSVFSGARPGRRHVASLARTAAEDHRPAGARSPACPPRRCSAVAVRRGPGSGWIWPLPIRYGRMVFRPRSTTSLLADHRAVARCVRRGRGRRGWAGVDPIVQWRGRENMISLLRTQIGPDRNVLVAS